MEVGNSGDPGWNGTARRFFEQVLQWPKLILAAAVVLMLPILLLLPRLTKDPRSEAFLPSDHPSLAAKEKTLDLFGLADPVVLALVAEDGGSIFSVQGLALVDRLAEELSAIDGVDPERVTSLASAMDVVGTGDQVSVEPFWEVPPSTTAEAQAVEDRVMRSTLLPGRLVARDGSATLIVAELLPGASESDVYAASLDLQPAEGFSVHVAGKGAISGFLSDYIDSDSRRLIPIAVLVIGVVLFLAYRSLRGVLLPQVVTVGALLAALGGMAMTGTPFFLITSGMLVLLIGVAVADTVHVLGQYYEEVAHDPDAPRRELVLRTMCAMWRPILITSLTDIGGLVALASSSFMPPMRAFGWYAALGVLAALVLSLFVLPSLLVLLPVKGSRAFGRVTGTPRDDLVGAALRQIGRWVVARPAAILSAALLVLVASLTQVPGLVFDDETIEYFDHDEAIYRADRSINANLDGTYYFDVLIDSGSPEGALDAGLLARVEKLTGFLEGQEEIRSTTSIVDVVRQVSATLDGLDDANEAELPQDADRIAQSVLVYLLGAGGEGLDGMADAELRWLLVRAHLGQSRYSQTRELVEGLELYLAEEFGDLEVALAGEVEIDNRWVGSLRGSHLRSLMFAALAILMVSSLSFGSLRLGALASFPVCLAVLLVYGYMAINGIWLSVGTTMFAAISLGTAIDFSIHTLDRLLEEHRRGRTAASVLPEIFATTGRALAFNVLALVLGFLTLTVSEVPSLRQFGSLVALSALASFFASLTLLPSLVLLFPSLLERSRVRGSAQDGALGEAVSLTDAAHR